MKFVFITLFPDLVDQYLNHGVLGKAIKNRIVTYEIVNLRNFGNSPHKHVDAPPYGGGGGMILRVDCLVSALESATREIETSYEVIHFSPRGLTFNQHYVRKETQKTEKTRILIGSRYEGVDQRFIDGWVDTEISLGDFILTNGDLAAFAYCDALTRCLPGVLGEETAAQKDSFSPALEGKLEYDQYTRPNNFRGKTVPPTLLSGSHQDIARWRQKNSDTRTQRHRPDLVK